MSQQDSSPVSIEEIAEADLEQASQARARRGSGAPAPARSKEERRAADEALAQAEDHAKMKENGPARPQPDKQDEPVRDVTAAVARGHVGAKTPTNSTGVRGLDYKNSMDELAEQFEQSDLATLLRRLSDHLLEYRSDAVHLYRVRVVLTLRCFVDVIKVLLRHDEKARSLWFQDKKLRIQLVTGFASHMAAGGKMRLDMGGYPIAMHAVYWAALQYVSRTFEEAVVGWKEVSGSSLVSAPMALNAHWRSANVETIVENDELVSDKQGSKLVTALLAVATSEHDFHGHAANQFKQHRAACKKMLAFLVAHRVARFPGDLHNDGKNDDDDDDERLQATAEAAFAFDSEVAMDSSYQPREDTEARVEGDPVLDLKQEEQKQIVAFTVIAERVVNHFAKSVRDHFPRVVEVESVPVRGSEKPRVVTTQVAPAIELPARTASERRKVIYVAHMVLDEFLVNSRRQLGAISPNGFYFCDFSHVFGNIYIGDSGGAFHAGPAGFSLVINCAAHEISNHYENFPTRTIEYLSLPLPHGPDGILAIRNEDWLAIQLAVHRHQEGRILFHSVDGRNRAAGVVFRVLQTCLYLDQRAAFEALFRACPVMDFVDVPRDLFQQAFEANFAQSLEKISFAHSSERLRIRYGANGLLPVTTLSPYVTFKSGGVKCSLFDYMIEFGVKRFGFERVSDFFASHVASALNDVAGPVYLVVYPPHCPGKQSELLHIILNICRRYPGRFVDASNVLTRVQESPQRSKGGSRAIELQLRSIACTLPDGANEASTFVCLDDSVNTGSSLSVFGLLMSRAGVSGDNLRGLALGRFSLNGPQSETVSEFVLPSTAITSKMSGAAPFDVCIDLPPNFVPTMRCTIVCERGTHKTVAFPSPADALAAACTFLASGLECCPHFAIDNFGYPAQLVRKMSHVVRIVRAPAKSLFVLSKVAGLQGSARNLQTQKAHKEWNTLEEEARADWIQRSALPVLAEDVRAALVSIYPPERNTVWELLEDGGGNHVRFSSSNGFKAALKEKQFGDFGFCVEQVFGDVMSRVWVPLALSHNDAIARIQTLSETGIVCTLNGASVTTKTLTKHDGGILTLTMEHIRTKCPLIKWGCDVTWSPTMQFWNEGALGLISWSVLKDVYGQRSWGKLLERALELYFLSLQDHCSATQFAGFSSALQAAQHICALLAQERGVLQKDIDGVVPLLALFHFSRKDIYRCLVYRDKLRGLSTAGGTLVHLGLHIPDLPWRGASELQRSLQSFRELSGVSRASTPFPVGQAEARITVLRSMLERLPIIDENKSLMKAASVNGVTTKVGAQDKLKAAKKLLEAWRQRLIALRGIACELPSFANAPGQLALLVQDLCKAFDK